MTNPVPGAGSNPQVGGSSANTPAANPQVGGLPNQTPASTGQPASSQTDSNPQAGGSGLERKPSPDVEAEWKRENQALRKRLEGLEADKKASEDAKLTEQERLTKRLADAERALSDNAIERQLWHLKDAIAEQASQLRLQNVKATVALLRSEYGDQLDYDEQGKPTNAGVLLVRLVEAMPWLRAPEAEPPQQQSPYAGRTVSPARTPNGQYAPARPQQPSVPPEKWPSWNEIEWTQPGQKPPGSS